MQDRIEDRQNYIRRYDPIKLEVPEDTELAFQLQNSHSNDTVALERMVFRYAGSLYRWISVLLFYRKMAVSSQEEIIRIMQKVYVRAIKNVEEFRGTESISDWLFGISYQLVRGDTDWVRSDNRHTQNNRDHHSGLSHEPRSAYWDSVDRLPEKLRLPLILRYLFDYRIPDIANILHIQVQDVHSRLIRARNYLLVNPIESHLGPQIQAYLDGLLDEDPYELNRLLQHLAECEVCQSSTIKINSLEKTLAVNIKKRWIFSTLSAENLKAFTQSVLVEITQSKTGWKAKPSIQQVAWTIGLGFMFIGLASLFIRLTPVEREFPQLQTTPTQQLPPVVEMQPALAPLQTGGESSVVPQYIEPAFSSDGNWAVFTMIGYDPITQAWLSSTIELYNREKSTIQVINDSTATRRPPWIWLDEAPSISGDGHWIAYVGSTNNPSVSGQPCETIDHKSCFDIFLYDRDTGLTRRSTQAINGGAADGDSIAPTVSEDGKWVAFWSAASNLVEGVNNTCQKGDANITCLYIYFYNVETGKIDWIPIRSIPGDPVFGVDRISLSADGRYVGFTVDQTTQIRIISPAIPVTLDTQENSNGDKVINTIIPGTLNNSEAMVYDRLTGNIELENQAQDGNPGDGPSSSPVLSADGRYVAFVSRSTNLVGGDTNNHSDVFFRDRETGEVELISISSIGWKGRGDSGLSFGDRGFYSLNISRDGRYVVFNSVATNLGQDLYSNCNKLDISVCNILYVHDRQSGSTEWINALANQDTSYFPQISSDGRWVTFMQTVTNCTSSQYLCSNVMLYDRQHAWMTNLTKFGEESPSLPWSYSESLKIPWEAWESPAITFSPDGKLLALAGIDSKVRIWQISDSSNTFSNDKPVEILEPDGNDSFSALAFNPGGDWLAAGTTLGTVYIWELSDGKIHYILKNQQNLIR